LGITGVSLHSYRYAWAERAYAAGYPERFAQAALGHSSKVIHRAYAKGAYVICPPLETPPENSILHFEEKMAVGEFA
jgi:integrase